MTVDTVNQHNSQYLNNNFQISFPRNFFKYGRNLFLSGFFLLCTKPINLLYVATIAGQK